jgi:hypothetical protein
MNPFPRKVKIFLNLVRLYNIMHLNILRGYSNPIRLFVKRKMAEAGWINIPQMPAIDLISGNTVLKTGGDQFLMVLTVSGQADGTRF